MFNYLPCYAYSSLVYNVKFDGIRQNYRNTNRCYETSYPVVGQTRVSLLCYTIIIHEIILIRSQYVIQASNQGNV